jgi:DNA-binding NarL/FixJ family response regulator
MRRVLTAREREVMFLVARALPNREIARQLKISQATVKVHLHSIFRKLAIDNRTMLAAMAIKEGASGRDEETSPWPGRQDRASDPSERRR